ncbi:MAG TPA: hypothetical protein VE173_00295 [Longimicrobiales bacterium]|nr:hypothetical protein [Longimicrobiales bacterium]
MGKGDNLGEFEQTVLFTLARLDGPASARAVYAKLVDVTERDVSVASVHVTLGRLEEKGAVGSSFGAGPEGLGREVRHFVLTPAGYGELRDARAHWERLWQGLDLDATPDAP